MWCFKLLLQNAHNTDAGFWEDITKDQIGPDTKATLMASEKKKADDARSRLQALKKKQGALKLVPQLITEKLMDDQNIISIVGDACWMACADQMTAVKTPIHHVQHIVEHCNGSWQKELIAIVQRCHLCFVLSRFVGKGVCGRERESGNRYIQGFSHQLLGLNLSVSMLHHPFTQYSVRTCFSLDAFKRLDLFSRPVSEATDVGAGLVDFLFHLVGNRAMSQVTVAGVPPIRYTNVMSLDAVAAKQAVAQMKDEWQAILAMEASHAHNPLDVVEDLYWLEDLVPRLVYLAFESSDFQVDSKQGLYLMHGIVQILPDTYICEDQHQFLRDLVRAGRHETQGVTSRMLAMIDSAVVPSRQLNGVSLNEAEVVYHAVEEQGARSKLSSKYTQTTESIRCKLPKEAQEIMKPTCKYDAPNPSSQFRCAVATEWVFAFWKQGLETKGISPDDGWMACLMQATWVVARAFEACD